MGRRSIKIELTRHRRAKFVSASADINDTSVDLSIEWYGHGDREFAVMTPAQARRLGQALIDLADTAERDQG